MGGETALRRHGRVPFLNMRRRRPSQTDRNRCPKHANSTRTREKQQQQQQKKSHISPLPTYHRPNSARPCLPALI